MNNDDIEQRLAARFSGMSHDDIRKLLAPDNIPNLSKGDVELFLEFVMEEMLTEDSDAAAAEFVRIEQAIIDRPTEH